MTKYTIKIAEIDLNQTPNPNVFSNSSTVEAVYEFMRGLPNEKLLHFYLNPTINQEEKKAIYNLEIFTETR